MIDVKEVLRRWSAGQSDRKIAREASVDRKAAARYTAVAASLFERGRELTDDEVDEVAQRVQARPAAPTSNEWSEVARHRPLIERWLAGDAETRPLRLTKIHTLLVRDHGLRASYDTLWRFAHEDSSGARSRPPSASTMRRPAKKPRSTSARWASLSTRRVERSASSGR